MDVFNAGLGTDSILINASNITALEKTGAGNRARVDGGGGVDTLKLDGAGLTLDLSVLVLAILTKPKAFTVSPLSPNTLRILVLVEASNRSFRLSFKVLSPEPLISIISIS
jgi:hypothetical protein